MSGFLTWSMKQPLWWRAFWKLHRTDGSKTMNITYFIIFPCGGSRTVRAFDFTEIFPKMIWCFRTSFSRHQEGRSDHGQKAADDACHLVQNQLGGKWSGLSVYSSFFVSSHSTKLHVRMSWFIMIWNQFLRFVLFKVGHAPEMFYSTNRKMYRIARTPSWFAFHSLDFESRKWTPPLILHSLYGMFMP